MQVKIGPYINYVGPHQIAEALCFWAKETKGEYGVMSKPDWVYNFGNFLKTGSFKDKDVAFQRDEHSTRLNDLCEWIHTKRKRTVNVKIDKWDTWNVDSTIAIVALPLLKQLRETKHGSPMVELEDVPEHMRTTSTEDYDSQSTFEFYYEDKDVEHYQYSIHDRWTWVLNEMIWAFEQLQPDFDWEKQYQSGEHDIQWKQCENGMSQMIDGPKNTYKCDYVALQKHSDRISNGLRLFGTYFRGLWD